ncbi:MAG: hypothetical protein ACXV4A_11120, partial [Actinomycetes bacterium]
MQTSSPAVTTPSPTPSATPVEAQVEAAVRAYYAELTRAAASSQTARLKTMVTSSCPCYRAVRVIDKNREQGEVTRGFAIDLTSVRVHDVISN